MTIQTISPEIAIVDGQPRVSSLAIAEHFQKPHADVLKATRRIASECPPEFIEGNFSLNEYMDDIGRSLPMYQLSRDGFTLLAMGFAGKKALTWKIKYIEAFNAMEKALLANEAKPKASPKPKALPFLPAPDTDAELEAHFLRIRSLTREIHEHEQAVYNIIKGNRGGVMKTLDARRTVLVNMHTVMDKLFCGLDYALEAAEFHAKSMCIMSRV